MDTLLFAGFYLFGVLVAYTPKRSYLQKISISFFSKDINFDDAKRYDLFRKSFWVSTFLFPILVAAGMMFITGYNQLTMVACIGFFVQKIFQMKDVEFYVNMVRTHTKPELLNILKKEGITVDE